MTTTPLNHYQVLMVDPEVDADILATVYRRLVQRYQSPLDRSGSGAKRLEAVERAYAVLADPHRRFRYDAQLADEAERADTMEPDAPAPRELAAMRDGPRQPAVVPVMTPQVAMAERLGGRQHATAPQAASATYRSPSTHRPAPHPGPVTRSVPVSVLDFGRYAGWSLRQLAAHDPDYLEWLLRSPGGRQYRAEITALLPQR